MRTHGTRPIRADVVVVGSGPNGLVAALLCARAGRHVVVLEAEDTIGGGCRTLPMDDMPDDAGAGLSVDPCSAVHPMAGVSPVLRALDLPGLGVELVRPPMQLAHALRGRDAVVADGPLDQMPRDWRRVFAPLVRSHPGVVEAVMSDQRTVPPPRAVAALITAFACTHPGALRPGAGAADVLGPDSRTLLAGIAAHAITPSGSPAATGVGLLLGTLLHVPTGWPVPVGGSGAITEALARALREAGGEIRTGHTVRSLSGIEARDVICDTSARVLGGILSGSDPSPRTARRARRLTRARAGGGAAKVDLVLSGPVPWRDPRLAGAGTVHLGGEASEIATAERAVASGRHADRPFVLVSQPWVGDPGRIAADGRRPLWTYAHVPYGSDRDVTGEVLSALEEVAPGVRDVVVAARCTPASAMADHNANYAGGDIAAGKVDVRGLVARPVARVDPHATGVPGVWHASASTPPGPGVHGMAGAHVARRILTGRRSLDGWHSPDGLR